MPLHDSGSSARNAVPTTTVGSTNGTVSSATIARRPPKESRLVTYAAGMPTSRVSPVLSTACSVVKRSTCHVTDDVSTASPAGERPRASTVTRGQAKNTPTNTTGTTAKAAPDGGR